MSRDAIALRVRRGRLHPVHRGVYAVGQPRLTLLGRYWAAVLACGGPAAAVLSHRAAARLWDLLPAPSGPVDVTTLKRSQSQPHIRVHRSRCLKLPDDVTLDENGLPRTTVARTLLDLAQVCTPHQLRRAVHQAERIGVLDIPPPASGRRTATLEQILAQLARTGPHLTRSELEERFLDLIGQFTDLPTPKVNAQVVGFEVDFLWSHRHLVVETDGAATHANDAAHERDRRRDAALHLAGYDVRRFTWRQVCEQPETVAAVLRAAYATKPTFSTNVR